MRQKWFIAILASILAGWSFVVQADEQPEQLYQIEIIVSSHITRDALGSEYWPWLPPPAIPPGAVELTDQQLLAQSQWVLKSTEQLLKHNNNPVLLHLAWQESATDLRKGKIFHLIGGQDYGNNLYQVNGTLAIRLERYFSIHFNLQFLMPREQIQNLNLTNIVSNPDNTYATFKIDENLRMRSNELNYLDHPLYGILIEIIPSPPPDSQ